MNPKSPYWVNDVYSLGYWLKDYGYYPKSWPLFNYMDHGITLFDTIPNHEIANDAAFIFKFSPRLVEEYKKVSGKPVYGLKSPTIHCRTAKKIEQTLNAKGTLFFPGHSTELIDDFTDWNIFIEDLKSIPDSFKPIDISLHPTDLKKGLDQIFISKGYSVHTAGNAHANDFAENMYNILKNYKYTMSNTIGSYVFYAIEMGIPFSLYGEGPKYFNKSDPNVEKGAFTSYSNQPTYQKAIKLFQGFNTVITAEQKEFVNFELGKYHSISRAKASYLLYKSLIQYFAKHPGYFKDLVNPFIKRKKVQIKIGLSKIPGLKRFLILLGLRKSPLNYTNGEYKLIEDGYVTTEEISNLKSGKKSTSTLLGNVIRITDSFWYLHSLNEIFVEEVYRFRATSDTPYILDCGSNIGLSIIYFKRLFPNAKIIAFEPDTHIFSLLKNNLKTFGCSDVTMENKAVWTEETVLSFSANGSLGGRINQIPGSNEEVIRVAAVRLRDYLFEQVEFLKIDIEGPEIEVLRDCSDLLKNVKNLFVEYHSDPNKDQEIDQLLQLLKKAGFRVYIKEAWNNLPLPFLYNNYKPYYDLQLNIFAYRI